jgi:hypothetical protein
VQFIYAGGSHSRRLTQERSDHQALAKSGRMPPAGNKAAEYNFGFFFIYMKRLRIIFLGRINNFFSRNNQGTGIKDLPFF